MGEDKLIAKMREVLPVGGNTLVWSGDDCAEIATTTGSFLISTDVLVEDVHFRIDWSSAFEVGVRAAQQNMADIMGQGGIVTALVVSLVIPPYLSEDWLCDLVAGFAAAVAPTGAGVVGGDLSRGAQLVISVTVCGESVKTPLPGSILRSGARPGDVVAVAGTLGYSYAGLQLLQRGNEQPEFALFKQIFKTPQPPLEMGPLAALAGATALMDVSDGLSSDLARLAKASQVSVLLSKTALSAFTAPLEAVAVSLGRSALDLVLNGGEDHALLACFPAGIEVPSGFTVIGSVEAGGAEVWLDSEKLSESGWDHFA
ncbi:thiamine-phosphate kinase [Gleimia coleocanis DSM 15436]|uniref:Thiamine-monophosphate kinase n=1 Tax=Gleimia coleocanis DSM 15436 TaxID=525245 RepID=C0VZD2_9ACTO|nr:thiamine-phosphate kinase [Gleimia coleocanis]EEH64233.1 thiamine-phosphate kinase [Gleimia coleocanis DSM 15436]